MFERVTARGGGATQARYVGDVRLRKCSKVFEVSEIVLESFNSFRGFRKCSRKFREASKVFEVSNVRRV